MQAAGKRLADVSEEQILAAIFPFFASSSVVRIGPGDDTALVSAASGAVLATTDAMVRDMDWRDDWSSPGDVGRKCVAQNVADIAAMGGVPTGLLVTLAADPATELAWVEGFAQGLAAAADDAGVSVVGGDLSSAPSGSLLISITALGDLAGQQPVRRSGAGVGDLLAVAGSLGRSDAGLRLLVQGRAQTDPELVAYHCAPRPPYELGPVAAAAGASAMIDISDGLIRDAGRIARASGVHLALETRLLAGDVAALRPAVGEAAFEAVLTGGEEHSLLACFPAKVTIPNGFRVIGTVREGAGVSVDGVPRSGGGWDHFAG